ncbi:hypothetical protein [Sediminitomix flava]|uniref:Ig-like domain-containing protein n=1 Tax=Sediminitomix flava TaxID=379075 RepID=A0A315Z915_SEDFL|nr:hypothetical protein [Sediminitomix flava]PWJ41991.1 hypothetical protein BC781_103241 [Sediminitomix flava]
MRIYFFLLVLLFSFPYLGNAQGVTGSIVINNNSSVTNHPEGKVNIKVISQGASQMQISRDGSFRGAVWKPITHTIYDFPLIRSGQEDGLKTLYAKFRDGNGNVSEVSSALIELDRQAPYNPSFQINGGLSYTNNKERKVQLILSCDEANYMMISHREDFAGAKWQPYRESLSDYKLFGVDGKKRLFARFKDLAGNMSEVVDASIILDITPPTNVGLAINNGAKYSKSNTVKLSLKADGATEVQLRGSDEWFPLQKEMEWELSKGDGQKVVYARFRDDAGNVSKAAKSFIIVDTTPPKFGKVVIAKNKRYITNYAHHSIELFVQGASHMMVSNFSDFRNGRWQPYTTTIANWSFPPGDGVKHLYAKFKDEANNISKVYSDSIILDSTPPKNPFVEVVHEGIAYDKSNDVKFLMSDTRKVPLAIKADDAKFMMISNVGNFYGASWQLYKTSVDSWQLEGEHDGVRQVYVRFRDKAGNISETAFDRVVIDNTPPVDARMVIDGNNVYTINKEKKTQLKLFARGADQMMISNFPTFDNAKWETYGQLKDWTLDGQDGVKSVFVKYKDFAGNVTEPVADEIILDRQPPFDCLIEINKGEEQTNHPDGIVWLKIRAQEAVKMQLSNSNAFSGKRWEKYNPLNLKWRLSPTDGDKEVFVRFMDEAGNISQAFSDKIRLNRRPPQEGKIVINDGGKLNNSNEVSLTISAKGATEMIVSTNIDFRGADWEPFNPKKVWKFNNGDGVKYLYIKFKDEIGNISRPVGARVGIDTKAPEQGMIVINKKEKYCTNINGMVTLRLFARAATKMMISNNSNFEGTDWQPFKPFVYDYMLDSEEDGEKYVYAKFSDDAGNATVPIKASIYLDRQEPVNEMLVINNGEKLTNNPDNVVSLEIMAEGADEMILSNSGSFNSATKWEPYRPSREWRVLGRDGAKNVFVKFRDKAGNESSVAKAKITLDTTPPIPRFLKINNGQTAVNTKFVNLTIQAKDASHMMVSNNPKFEGALWEPYSDKKPWQLTDGPGLKRVFVKFKDAAGNVSGNKWAEITYYQGSN